MQFNSKDAVKHTYAKYKKILFFIAQIIFLKDFAEKG